MLSAQPAGVDTATNRRARTFDSAMPRVPRYLLPDGLFHATARGAGQIAIYRDDDDRRAFLGLLSWVVHDFRWTCHGFCLMTNHYHLVIEAT